MQLSLRYRDRTLAIAAQRRDAHHFTATVDGQAHEVRAEWADETTVHLTCDGTSVTAHAVRVGTEAHVAVDGEIYVFAVESGSPTVAAGTLASPQIVAPMPGKVLQVLVSEGQEVAAGDGLCILEAMKMENRIVAEAAAVVRAVHVRDGQTVDGGTLLLELEYRTA
jgi:biotin carboxyl carrier protein